MSLLDLHDFIESQVYLLGGAEILLQTLIIKATTRSPVIPIVHALMVL